VVEVDARRTRQRQVIGEALHPADRRKVMRRVSYMVNPDVPMSRSRFVRPSEL